MGGGWKDYIGFWVEWENLSPGWLGWLVGWLWPPFWPPHPPWPPLGDCYNQLDPKIALCYSVKNNEILIITTNVLHVFLLNTFPLSICGSANPFDTGVLARLGVKIEITQGFFPILYTVGVYFQCSKAF